MHLLYTRTSLHTLNIINFRHFYIQPCFTLLWAGIAKSVLRLAKDWTVRVSNPSGGEVFRALADRSRGPTSLLCNGYRFFPGSQMAGTWLWSPTPSSAEVKGRVVLFIYSPSGPSWPVLGWTLPFVILLLPSEFLPEIIWFLILWSDSDTF
jgi:hypothetical protein